MRVKELELSYNFKLNKNMHIDRFRLFVNGNNLLTYSPNTRFGDPEKSLLRPGADGSYPLLRRYNIGIQLSF
jgi:hypothetical protein